MLEVMVATILAGISLPPPAPACDTTSERLTLLAAAARRFRSDSVWARHLEEWGWKVDDPVEPVLSGSPCDQALEALRSDGQGEIAQVALVRVGAGYVVQPGDRWDYWIVLDKDFRVLTRIFVA